MAENLRGQLNSSFDRDGAKLGKCVPLPGGGWDEREFSTWAPTWIAGIKHVPETVEDRSVVLRLKRKLTKEKVMRLRGKDGGELKVLKRKIARFVADNERRLRDADPIMPDELEAAGDRAADAWDPLIAIADIAGGDWPKRTRDAALALAGVDKADTNTGDADATLLADIEQIFDDCHVHRLSGKELTNALLELEERPWSTWNKGKPFTQHQLARFLRHYGAISQTIRDGGVTFKGYHRRGFEDAFDRYLSSPSSCPPGSTRHVVTSPEKPGEKQSFELVTKAQCDELKNAENACNSVACDGVTSSNGGKGQNEVQDDIEAQLLNAVGWRGVRL
jgi:hypothetical protein